MKIYNYVIMAAMLMFLMYLAGFDVASSFIFSKLGAGDIQSLTSFPFWVTLTAVFAAVTTGGAIIGSIMNISPTYVIKSIFIMSTLTLLVSDFIIILVKLASYGNNWVLWGISAIMIPLIAGYAIALIEFWEGRD